MLHNKLIALREILVINRYVKKMASTWHESEQKKNCVFLF